jgi:hypothetical protein
MIRNAAIASLRWVALNPDAALCAAWLLTRP